MGLIDWPVTKGKNYQSTLRNIPEEGMPDLHRGGSLKLRTDYVTAHCTGHMKPVLTSY